MSPAEYRTVREACGLSLQAAAVLHGVPFQTVEGWEVGRLTVPTSAAGDLRTINARIERGAQMAVQIWEDSTATEPVMLVRYRSPDDYARRRDLGADLAWPCYEALVVRMMLALERAGATVRVEYA
ncbi:MAG: hypothetical protein WDN25_13215 [Acetobacteraceae bacterium]